MNAILLCVGVGVFLELLFRGIHIVLCKQKWYLALSVNERSKCSRRLTTVIHHIIVVTASLYALSTNNHGLWLNFLIFQAAFDVCDSFGWGSFSGMNGTPLVLHHGVAMVMEWVFLTTNLDWHIGAMLCVSLLGTGAFDIFCMKVLARTPVAETNRLFFITLTQFGVFLTIRVGYFSYLGLTAIPAALSIGYRTGLWISLAWLVMSCYNCILGTAMVLALMNGGAFPSLGSKPRRLMDDMDDGDFVVDEDDDESKQQKEIMRESKLHRFGVHVGVHDL